MRVITTANFTREVDARWYGIGNASVVGGAPPKADPTRYNEYVDLDSGLRTFGRIKTGTMFDAAFATNFRYEAPSPFAVTKLGQDAAAYGLPGTQQAFVATVAAGVVIDTRDNEFVPKKGVYYQLGGAGTLGSAERVGYGELSAVLSSYVPVIQHVTLATRVMTSFEIGRVAFYDLQQGSVFNQQYMVGGIDGVRGVRLGRYAGRVKILANYEIRTEPVPKFKVAGFKLQVGTTTFFDAGRVWSDYDTPQFDGTSLGLKWGAGGGFYFQFDKSSVFRVEAAYSPDEDSVSFYLASGLIF
jgi:outer membrane protein assembly factor BamA